MTLRQLALELLQIPDPDHKAARVLASPDATSLPDGADMLLAEPACLPGRPDRPQLVPARQLPQRAIGTPEGRVELLHALAHIEHNAINLALDAVWRFAGMPPAYYHDWMRVAAEEALHFTLLRDQLRMAGCTYGDFPAHDGLWDMTHRTRHDVCARMALVPRTLEARGLDATPLIQARLRKTGAPDAMAAVAILDTILRDETGHVAIGNHWYRWVCERDGLDPLTHYGVLARHYGAPRLRGPFNLQARRAAGFTDAELAALASVGPPGKHAPPGQARA